MAGGMGGHRGIPMSRRVTLSSAAGEECPARHCWVADPADASGVKRPGLLVEWRAAEGGWEGRVVYAAQLRSGLWALVEEWLPAILLAPR
jgi:hypothetical protein